jgi:S1-C subfamily serine protease
MAFSGLGEVAERMRRYTLLVQPGDRGSGSGMEPGSPAATASLLPGDILLGTEEQAFASNSDLAGALDGASAGLLRLRFLRGDYCKIRCVSVWLHSGRRSSLAA